MYLLTSILRNKVQAPGYIGAVKNRDEEVLAAYNNASWQGAPVPNIDEEKEIKAVRLMLGADAANYPLITHEEAIEKASNGEFKHTIDQYSKEMDYGETLGIDKVLPKGSTLEGKEPEGDGNANTKK